MAWFFKRDRLRCPSFGDEVNAKKEPGPVDPFPAWRNEAMSKKRRWHLLAAGGWLLVCAWFSWVAWDHATGDLSEFERPGPGAGPGDRLPRCLYNAAGRRGLVALDLGLLTVGLIALIVNLRRGLIRENPEAKATDHGFANVHVPAESTGCACCRCSVQGMSAELPERAVSIPGTVGYVCRSCGALFCTNCAEKRIGRSWWDGWARKRCPVCGRRFAPNTVVVKG